MFIVKRIVKRGFFRDKVLVEATKDASLNRKRLGWDVMQAPDLKMETFQVSKGAELTVRIPRGSFREGQTISPDQALKTGALNRLWKRTAS